MKEIHESRALTGDTRKCVQDMDEVIGIQLIDLRYRLVRIPKVGPEDLVFADVRDSYLPGEPRFQLRQSIHDIRQRHGHRLDVGKADVSSCCGSRSAKAKQKEFLSLDSELHFSLIPIVAREFSLWMHLLAVIWINSNRKDGSFRRAIQLLRPAGKGKPLICLAAQVRLQGKA